MQPHPSSSAHIHGTPYLLRTSTYAHTHTEYIHWSPSVCQVAWSITGAFSIWSGSVRCSGRNRPAGLPNQLLHIPIHGPKTKRLFRSGPSPVATAPSDPIYRVHMDRKCIHTYIICAWGRLGIVGHGVFQQSMEPRGWFNVGWDGSEPLVGATHGPWPIIHGRGRSGSCCHAVRGCEATGTDGLTAAGLTD